MTSLRQGLWGSTGLEAELEERRQGEFVEHNVATFRSEFVVLHTSFKVSGLVLPWLPW